MVTNLSRESFPQTRERKEWAKSTIWARPRQSLSLLCIGEQVYVRDIVSKFVSSQKTQQQPLAEIQVVLFFSLQPQ